MTVSERTVDGTFLEGNGSLVCAILRQPESRGVLQWLQFSQRWDLALTLLLQGEARSWLLRYWPPDPLLCRTFNSCLLFLFPHERRPRSRRRRPIARAIASEEFEAADDRFGPFAVGDSSGTDQTERPGAYYHGVSSRRPPPLDLPRACLAA